MFRSFYTMLVFPLVIPPVAFFSCALMKRVSISSATLMVVERYSAEKYNLFISSILGFVPVIALLLIMWISRRFGATRESCQLIAWGGLLPILLVLSWIHFQFWPSYLPSREFLGFPHGLEFVIGPLFFAPIAMCLGIAVSFILRSYQKQE